MSTAARLPCRPCPCCGTELDAATPTDAGHPVPEPGDITICAYCAELLVFDDELKVIRMPEEVKKGLDDAQRKDIEKWQVTFANAPWNVKH